MIMNKLILVSPRNSLTKQQQQTYNARAIDIDEKGRLIIVRLPETINSKKEILSSSVVSIRPTAAATTTTTTTSTNHNSLSSIIYIYCDEGTSLASVTMIKNSLMDIIQNNENYVIKEINATTLCNNVWRKHIGYHSIACLIFPGGADCLYMKELETNGGNMNISNYVRIDGGCYIGFCAGAYYGCKNVKFDLNGKLEVNEKRSLCFYNGNGIGPVYNGFEYENENGSRATTIIRTDDDSKVTVYYNGGCTFEKNNDEEDDKNNIQITSYYYDNTNNKKKKNIASMNIKCGLGNAILCGVHPEFQPHQMITSKTSIIQKILLNDSLRYSYMKYILQPMFDQRNLTSH
jgi:biotin--protein ligase